MTEYFKSANNLNRKNYFQQLMFFKYEKEVDNIFF